MVDKDYLDHQFRELFRDKTQEGFPVGDHLYIKMIRKDTLKNSYIEVYKDGVFWYRERLGRFNTYRGFLNATFLILG